MEELAQTVSFLCWILVVSLVKVANSEALKALRSVGLLGLDITVLQVYLWSVQQMPVRTGLVVLDMLRNILSEFKLDNLVIKLSKEAEIKFNFICRNKPNHQLPLKVRVRQKKLQWMQTCWSNTRYKISGLCGSSNQTEPRDGKRISVK